MIYEVLGKVFERCEFARELVNKQGFARATVGNWVCLANVRTLKLCKIAFIIKIFFQYESSYNTGATNDNTNGSRDYGIFQINDNYWCDSNVGYGADCNVACNKYNMKYFQILY